MSTPIVFNGTNYSVPAFGDGGYAQGAGNLSLYLIALASGTFQPTGGNFTLLADANFGPSFGLISVYYKSFSANIATAGVLRLSNTDTIDWRNFANSGNLALGVNSSNQLVYNGTAIAGGGAGVTTITGTANQVLANGTTGTPQAGAVTLTTPQDIAPTSSPQFATLTVGSSSVIGRIFFQSPTDPVNPEIILGNALANHVSGIDEIGIGNGALGNSTTGNENIAIGSDSLLQLTTGDSNVAIGNASCGGAAFVPIGNTFLGTSAGSSWSGSPLFNIGIGNSSLNFVSGTGNIGIGSGSGFGNGPGVSLINGTNCTMLGASTDMDSNTASYGVAIGALAVGSSNVCQIGTPSGTGSLTVKAKTAMFNNETLTDVTNQLVLGSTNTTTINSVTPTAARIVTIPDAGANSSVVLTQGTQTIAGQTTLSNVAGNPIHGTNTNNNAAAGFTGEYVESVINSGASVALVSATPKTVTSISLTAGDWDLSGLVGYLNGGTQTLAFQSSSLTTNTQSGNETARSRLGYTTVDPANLVNIPTFRYSLAATTTIFLIAEANFTVTCSAFGRISARRVR